MIAKTIRKKIPFEPEVTSVEGIGDWNCYPMELVKRKTKIPFLVVQHHNAKTEAYLKMRTDYAKHTPMIYKLLMSKKIKIH